MRIRLMALGLMVMAGCAKGPKTPEQAFQKLEVAIAAGDAVAAYEVLDQPTKWSIQSALKDQRLQRTIISAKYPEAEAQKALAQLKAAEETEPAQFFKRINDERHVIEAHRKRLGAVSGPIKSKIEGPDSVWVVRQEMGLPFHFSKNRDGTWGWSELRGDWDLERDRAQHAVKTVQENAKLYQKTEGQ